MRDPEEEGEGLWISPGARRRLRRMTILVAFFVIVLGVIAWVALDTRDNLADETSARIDGNVRALTVGCEHVNDLARAVKEIIGSQGSVITPIDVSTFGFADPKVTEYVQAIVDRSARNAEALRAEGEKIKLIDCAAVAREESGTE
jgi:hypothetical protein